LGGAKQILGGDSGSRPGHVFHHEIWFSGNMISHVARDDARVGVKSPARRSADDDADGLARIEVLGENSARNES
jgi:hypothetical protein